MLAGRFAGVCGAELVNLYGPTEASVDVTFHVVEGVVGVGVPIGRPVWNTRVLVWIRGCGGSGGCGGELYVVGCRWLGGMRVVWFDGGSVVADPVSGVVGARCIGRVMWCGGGVVGCGVCGAQGFSGEGAGQRVELGEVEAVLAAQVGVAGAVVVLRSGVGGIFGGVCGG